MEDFSEPIKSFYEGHRLDKLTTVEKMYLIKKLMDDIEKIADTMGFNKLKLNSQSTAIPFYEKRGYEINSPEFMDAGIPHRAMVKHQATS